MLFFSLRASIWVLATAVSLQALDLTRSSCATCQEFLLLNQSTGFRNEDISSRADTTIWYIERSEVDHQNDISALMPQGYRLSSLQLTGTRPLHYNVVWSRTFGPLQQTSFGLDGDSFDKWLFFWTDQGYIPTMITATGPEPDLTFIYIAVVEKKAVGSWFVLRDQSLANLKLRDAEQIAKGRIMVYLSQYGEDFFAAIWHDNPHNTKAAWFSKYSPNSIDDPAFSEVSKPNWRP